MSGLLPAGIVAAASTANASGDVAPVARPAHEIATVAAAKTAPPPAVQAHAIAAAPQPAAVKQAAAPAPPEPPAALVPGPLGIPPINFAAYKNAERMLAQQDPACGMPWSLLAGIGRVESTQANNGNVDANGTMITPIYGPILDGSLAGNNVVADTDGGALDGNATYDRAVGPMQFLPETWKRYGSDGNGDGKADPQNIFDAALTTGKYLCDGGLNMGDLAQRTTAILRYNNSMAYVANVMAWSLGYATGIVPTPQQLPRI
ncbi:murein transglycosylase [Skermania sp. ID1734]|nr:murein transglycosylase [Skermania sp. ID1734]